MPSYMRIGLGWGLCLAAGILSIMFISTDVGSWYSSLRVPSFTPPAWTFPLIVVAQYVLMAIAVSSMWIHDPLADEFSGWVPLFFAHLTSNMAWTILFFGFQAIFLSMVNAVILVIAVFLLVCGAWHISRLAFWCLVPYLMWVVYGLTINLGIWLLN